MTTWRVSNVEQFRQWEADDDAELPTLLASLRGEREPSAVMVAGSAFHKALELSPTGIDVGRIGANGYTFLFEGEGFEVELPGIRELRASKVFTVDDHPITISGQVDAIHGRLVIDHKTTARFDPERYLSGYAWRLYLSIFGATHFRWNVFEIQPTDDPMLYRVMDQHRLTQYRYPGLEDDCQCLVERFARFVREHLPEALLAA